MVRMSRNEILDFYMSTKRGWIRCHGAVRRDTISAQETERGEVGAVSIDTERIIHDLDKYGFFMRLMMHYRVQQL